MMISDEPDEDADSLDDDNLLITYLDGALPKPQTDAAPVVSDWPPAAAHELGLNVDAETQRWFETNYSDWRKEMCSVLRGWVEAQTRRAAVP